MKEALISIVMPAYCASKTIEESIQSVLSQSYTNWELLIIDDCSADATSQIINEASEQDPRIHIFTNENNQGVAATRNRGIQESKGEYIAFLDSDDLWHKEKLDKQIRIMKEKDATISFTGTAYINTVGKVSKYVLQAEEYFGYNELLKRNIISCSSVMVRRENMIPFPMGYMHEDFAVWLKIVKKAGQAYGLNEPLLIYRMGEETKSSNRIKSAQMTWGAYRHVGYGLLTSFFYTLRYAKHSISKRYLIQVADLNECGRDLGVYG